MIGPVFMVCVMLPIKVISEANSRLAWLYAQRKGLAGQYAAEVLA